MKRLHKKLILGTHRINSDGDFLLRRFKRGINSKVSDQVCKVSRTKVSSK